MSDSAEPRRALQARPRGRPRGRGNLREDRLGFVKCGRRGGSDQRTRGARSPDGETPRPSSDRGELSRPLTTRLMAAAGLAPANAQPPLPLISFVWYRDPMANEPENLVLALLRGIRAEIADIKSEMATKSDLADVRAELQSLRADVASDLLAMQAKADAEHKATRRSARSRRASPPGLRIPLQRHRPRHAHQRTRGARSPDGETPRPSADRGELGAVAGRRPTESATAKNHSMEPRLSPAYLV